MRDACDRNLTAAFAGLVPHSRVPSAEARSFGRLTAIATGYPIAFYNPVLVTDARATPDELIAAIGWIRSLGFPASVQLHDELQQRFEAVIRELGLVPDPWATPGMALHPIPPTPPPPTALGVELVDHDRFDDWHEGIGYGPRFREIFRSTLVDDPAFRIVVGYADGVPVTGAVAIMSDGVVGVYAVGTAEHARRLGFGEAATWAAVEAGVQAGCSIAVLQSSEMALGLYRRMGFVEVCQYVECLPA
jgi:GNAT superfamily N-acetyltransferase